MNECHLVNGILYFHFLSVYSDEVLGSAVTLLSTSYGQTIGLSPCCLPFFNLLVQLKDFHEISYEFYATGATPQRRFFLFLATNTKVTEDTLSCEVDTTPETLNGGS